MTYNYRNLTCYYMLLPTKLNLFSMPCALWVQKGPGRPLGLLQGESVHHGHCEAIAAQTTQDLGANGVELDWFMDQSLWM